MRTVLIVGNWKMNKTASEAATFVRELTQYLPGTSTGVEFVIAPPFTALESVSRALRTTPTIQLGAQDMFWEDYGAYTGEVSAPMLKDLGCRYVILGHSERRTLFGEESAGIRKKIRAALKHGLGPILCIGESLAQRDNGSTDDVLTQQLRGSLSGFTGEALAEVTIAYEPIWAIGTGKTASTQQAQEMHAFLRGVLAKQYSKETADEITILYGGSVKANNASELFASPDVDGGLVGGASLNAKEFIEIMKALK